MAEALTHYYFFKEVINNLDDKYINQLNIKDYKLFLYSNILDIPKYYNLRKFRAYDYNLKFKLHNQSTKKLIEELVKYTRKNSYDADNILLLYGVVSQYVLDKNINPFIISRAGIYKKQDIASIKNKFNRNILEKAIDSLLLKDNENLDILDIDLTKKFNGAFKFNFLDLNMLEEAINNTYFFSNAFTYYRVSIKNFKLFSRKMPLHINKLRYIFQKSFREYGHKQHEYIKDYSVLEDKDYLNNAKSNYPNCTTNAMSNYSFTELYNKAIEEAKVYFNALNKYLFLHDKKSFDKTFENISLDTGTPENDAVIKYSKSIFN